MTAYIKSGIAAGEITAPSSKSVAHRLLISAALADGVSTLRGIDDCEDILATVDCLRALGADIKKNKDSYTVRGFNPKNAVATEPLFCRESGSTLRFIIPIASLCGMPVRIEAAPSLMRRPLSVYEKIFGKLGLEFSADSKGVSLRGPISAGEYVIPGDISSQFITGLIFALIFADGESKITVTEPYESKSYVDITVDIAKKFGANICYGEKNEIIIRNNAKLNPIEISCEGDYSGAAFLDALNILGGEITVKGLVADSKQGDRVYKNLFSRLDKGYSTIDISDCPDLGPILFAVAAAKHGGMFLGTKRLKIKESDRACAMAEELKKFGISAKVGENFVEIESGILKPPDSTLCGHNDHRIVMSLAVLCTLVGGEISGAEAISKSYPNFFRDISFAGIEVNFNEQA